ncbi:MAG: ATP-binding cassette domain-containing protein [Deltaproteobacteria bacterium]|nr:ATP-binding cassette domain-containing protein [Deltaproteobacteria bacterium]
MISLRNVYYRFPHATNNALDGISWEVKRGQYACICGANGSGKTTLLKHLNGLLKPTLGEVVIGEGHNSVNSAVCQQVGIIFQNPEIQIIGATVEEDIAFGPENLALPPPQIRQRIDQSLEKLGITHLRERETHTLSGGEKRLVAIAGILAMEPEVIAMDEPTAFLDYRAAQALRRVITELLATGITVIHITHCLEDALSADNIAIMGAGKILCSGTPQEVFSKKDLLQEAGIKIPPIAELLGRLKEQGFNIDSGAATTEAAYTQLLNLLQRSTA